MILPTTLLLGALGYLFYTSKKELQELKLQYNFSGGRRFTDKNGRDEFIRINILWIVKFRFLKW